jgi:hypothetical protein
MIAGLDVPAGAMQFEAFPSEANHRRPVAVWVLPPIPRVDYTGCTRCTTVYPVIEELIPERYRPAMEARRRAKNPRGKFFVCACMGRVIE